MTQAMDSYLAFCGNEIVNIARLKAYVDNGIRPKRYEITPRGCEGLIDILPCEDSDPPLNGYQLPELDDAPWYDPAVPESKNFAGLMVTGVTVSAPYSRNVTPNINQGQTLGRLKTNGRTIVVHGFLIGKTCCATSYGLAWLTSALGDPPCGGGDNCGGCSIEFLSCCPNFSGEDECLTIVEAGVRVPYVRPAGATEYTRGSDFFRRMNGVGVVDGPNEISSRGASCGCGGGTLIEVEFTLATSSPYMNSFGTVIADALNPPDCGLVDLCDIIWSTDCTDARCPDEADELADLECDPGVLPPPIGLVSAGCGCIPFNQTKICVSAAPEREWLDSTLNIMVKAGTTALRNVMVHVHQNPLGLDCGDEAIFPECAACATFLINHVPAGATFILSGEERKVVMTKGSITKNASSNVTDVSGQPFDWPDITCASACVCLTFDCANVSEDAEVTVVRIDREL